ncbi:L-idonate 5-dehydrogenase [Kineosporia sp. R_H_3]|uniref:L-idonate 5-dehydrogenase n=1 Tax=Kineosporia sp. R_H_3 TaxID=1961848 RepID=UPI000B4B7FB4|nr:L-idonate 5-dehydrogenase [Kineosporia sp. R_H_3]
MAPPSSTRTVRALVAHGAGDVRVEEHPAPVPGPGQVAVRIAYGGVCGSDLHYWRHGRVGDFYLREPLTLGHEVVGTVLSVGPGATGAPAPGTPVAVHPATPCGTCPECRSGRRNVCRAVRYLGSAAHLPHVQGGLVDVLVVPADQAVALPDGLSLLDAAVTEPASVAWHAVTRAGDVRGARVLVTGAGPIGALVVAALHRAGAAEVVVTDVAAEPLARAAAVGATTTVVVGPDAPAVDGRTPDEALAALEVDVAIESSGSPAGLGTCVRAVRRSGRVVTLGLLPPGDVPFPGNLVVTREIELVGTFRFDHEIHDVLAALADGSLVTGPVVTHVLPLARAAEALELAGDPRRSGKVLLDLTDDLDDDTAGGATP